MTIIILFLLMIFFISLFSIKGVPFTDYRLSFISEDSKYSNSINIRINETSFDIDKEGEDWVRNNTYPFTIAVKSNTEFFGSVIVYLKPSTENYLHPPIAQPIVSRISLFVW